MTTQKNDNTCVAQGNIFHALNLKLNCTVHYTQGEGQSLAHYTNVLHTDLQTGARVPNELSHLNALKCTIKILVYRSNYQSVYLYYIHTILIKTKTVAAL